MSRPSPVDVSIVRSLRGALLRPGQSEEQLRYPGDDAADTLHAAVMRSGAPLGVASVMRDPCPLDPDEEGDWRVRGMATLTGSRRLGIGSALLGACEAHARAQGGRRMWCNARVAARGFYERGGLHVAGEIFEIPGIGPHYLMLVSLGCIRVPERSLERPVASRNRSGAKSPGPPT